ncbi:hypothetical protein [Streptomyces sp. DSM 15324]|uniref:hypothetical protein n=1 Tax=Streptomyces sp. DSM 15324 TaxID=1739111 RepID=UPI00074A8392|nr:hypothetical protein [Streptomyces sp. DSM 15324]KUO11281.1 hypothetical protein AQJ58_14700 [Streptomyces sp. DSM 15324]
MTEGHGDGLTGPDVPKLAERLWTRARDEDGGVPLEVAVTVAELYWRRHQASGAPDTDGEDLGHAVALYTMIAEVAADAVPEPLRPLVAQATAQVADGRSLDSTDDLLNRAVDRLEAAVSGDPAAHLDEAIGLFRSAVEDERRLPEGDARRAAALSNLGMALRKRAERTEHGGRADVDESVRVSREALAHGDGDDRAAYLGNLMTSLGTRYAWTGAEADLDEAVLIGEEALACTPPDEPRWATHASNLSGLLRIRFDVRGTGPDLDEAVRLSERAARATPDHDPARSLRWSNLSNALAARFDLRRSPDDLDDAVDAGRRAVQAVTAQPGLQAPVVANLGNLLLTRFEHWGETADLDEAIGRGRDALAAGHVGAPAEAALRSNLGNAHRSRFDSVRDPQDLVLALSMTREAAAATGEDEPQRASRWSNLAMALMSAYEYSRDPAYLEEAIEAGRTAVEATGADELRTSKYLSNVAILLATRKAPGDLEEAVGAATSAVTMLSPDDPARAIRLVNLAGVLLDGVPEAHDERASRRAAYERYREASALVTAATSVRLMAAQRAGDRAAADGDWTSALASYEDAVALLERLVSRRISRRSRERQLSGHVHLAGDAAAGALRGGAPERAVALLERGRGVLWSQILDLVPDPEFAARHPELAGRLADVASALD